MAALIYLTNVTVDGYIEDDRGSNDLFAHDEDVFRFTTELLATTGTYLYGRRLYESMAVFESMAVAEQYVDTNAKPDLIAQFASTWQAADKIVYSTTLDATSTARTRLERVFDPSAVSELKAAASKDLLIGGADLAAQAMDAGLIDEYQLFVWPLVLGAGKPALPAGMRVGLELIDERRFDNGTLYLRYRPLRA